MERMAKAAEGAASRVQLTQVLLALLVQTYLLYWYNSANTGRSRVQLTQVLLALLVQTYLLYWYNSANTDA